LAPEAPSAFEPLASKRRRRQSRQRFILISAVLLVAVMVIWALVGSFAFLAAKLRVFG
jgi:uncharacterized membrane protein (DUF485 family)